MFGEQVSDIKYGVLTRTLTNQAVHSEQFPVKQAICNIPGAIGNILALYVYRFSVNCALKGFVNSL